MLHVITTLWRYENLEPIWESLKDYENITWHLSKVKNREIDKKWYETKNVKVWDLDCDDKNTEFKKNAVLDSIENNNEFFCILDDDTVFHDNMYKVYEHFKSIDFKGMVIGHQVYNNKIRLKAFYPRYCFIDAGNVLCHTDLLKQLRWKIDPKTAGDFHFWDRCFKILGTENTILVDSVISVYNKLSKETWKK